MRCPAFASWTFTIMALSCSAGLAEAAAPWKSGDRVVFLGDSITEQNLYTRYVEQYLLCRYPGLKLAFFNAGDELLRRLASHSS
jgi:hypothetical protein